MTSNSDDVALVRAGRVERRTEKLAELRHRWLRGIGYVARPLVFLLAIGAWIVFWYVWLARADISRRPIGSLTLKQIIEPFVWFILWLSPLLLVVARFINIEGDIIEWEAWGLCGLGLVVIGTAAALWLAYG